MPFFIDEIYWLSLSQWSRVRENELFLSCFDISVFSCALLYVVLLLSVLSRKFLQNQNKSSIKLSLSYPSNFGQKIKPFSKIDFSDGENCFSDMSNMIEPSKFLVVGDGFLLVGDRPECCFHLNFQ